MLPEIDRKLRIYEGLLRKWQKAINLVGSATLDDVWNRHFEDAIQLEPLIPESAKTLYDLGSGAGFPGLVLAILKSDLDVTLIESDEKKCAFLSVVSHETKTPVTVLSQRIKIVTNSLPAPDIVTARALKSLGELLGFVWPWAQKNPGLICIFPKGVQAQNEIDTARKEWNFDCDIVPSKTEPSASILVVKKIDRKDRIRA